MADSEASGEAWVGDPVDDRVDTDQLAVVPPENDEAPTADAEFGYLFDADQPEVVDEYADEPIVVPEWVEPAPPTEAEEQTFDAFNATTWNFKPAPTPWYRTGLSLTVIVALSIAVVALVVSVVLLAFRGSPAEENIPANAPGTSTAPTTETAPVATSEEPPPPPPPPAPPPPPPTAAEVSRAPVYQRPPQPTKKPEINVTRSPMSVHPQMPSTKRP
ncbi:MAG: hypothetical protein JWR46_1957 [Mycobacterium sp.]|nr:hypothetical protein [Mycobacterium sp.]